MLNYHLGAGISVAENFSDRGPSKKSSFACQAQLYIEESLP